MTFLKGGWVQYVSLKTLQILWLGSCVSNYIAIKPFQDLCTKKGSKYFSFPHQYPFLGQISLSQTTATKLISWFALTCGIWTEHGSCYFPAEASRSITGFCFFPCLSIWHNPYPRLPGCVTMYSEDIRSHWYLLYSERRSRDIW